MIQGFVSRGIERREIGQRGMVLVEFAVADASAGEVFVVCTERDWRKAAFEDPHYMDRVQVEVARVQVNEFENRAEFRPKSVEVVDAAGGLTMRSASAQPAANGRG